MARVSVLRQHARCSSHLEKERRMSGATTSQQPATGEGADMVAEADSDVEWTEDSIKKVNTKVAREGHSTRYLQRYLKEWESQPQFAGWLAPVHSNQLKARCLCCQVMLNAHSTGLLHHANTAKHVQRWQSMTDLVTQLPLKEGQPPNFRPMLIVASGRPSQLLLSTCCVQLKIETEV